jgi:dihydrodipicolinate synthase/N-acetylneuraminate lyase
MGSTDVQKNSALSKENWLELLRAGVVIPACPLALTAERKFDERRQRALVRYYVAAGGGGLATGVHSTQFAIRDHGLYRPVLELVAEELKRAGRTMVRIAGACGDTGQAVGEAQIAKELGYHSVLLSLGALRTATDDQLIEHCGRVAEVLPLIGFYLQPSAGGRLLPYSFWHRFAEIQNVVAIKIAPFNRYQTIDVLRAVAESGRDDIALYTGNDDNIVLDLITPFRFSAGGKEMRIVGGLLGHWAVWTKRAVELLNECHRLAKSNAPVPRELLRRAIQITDANAAFFDAANGYAGCIPGIHEVLRRQGLLAGTWCLNPHEQLSPGQAKEIDRVYAAYPELSDDQFVREHLDGWLRE